MCKLSVCHARSVPVPAAFVVLSPAEQIVQHPLAESSRGINLVKKEFLFPNGSFGKKK